MEGRGPTQKQNEDCLQGVQKRIIAAVRSGQESSSTFLRAATLWPLFNLPKKKSRQECFGEDVEGVEPRRVIHESIGGVLSARNVCCCLAPASSSRGRLSLPLATRGDAAVCLPCPQASFAQRQLSFADAPPVRCGDVPHFPLDFSQTPPRWRMPYLRISHPFCPSRAPHYR